tara:strand:+ start:3564 stop:4019 length:456 start_codon:yes stop_codon:yes gene_type:complete
MNDLVSGEARGWIGKSDDPVEVEVTRRDIIKYSVATEQVLDKYINGNEAPPMFVAGLFREIIPICDLGFDGLPPASLVPDLPLKRVMAGGVSFRFHRTVKPGDVLVFSRTLSNIVGKKGKTGPLIFVTYSITCETKNGEPVLDQEQTRILR